MVWKLRVDLHKYVRFHDGSLEHDTCASVRRRSPLLYLDALENAHWYDFQVASEYTATPSYRAERKVAI